MPLTLYHIPHSPWSYKARCALAHHGLTANLVEYTPFVDEPALRLRIARNGGSFWGRITVPVLFTGDAVVRDSWEIARYADRQGDAPRLIPFDDRETVAEWNRRSELFLDAGRARFTLRVLQHDEALRELSPPALTNLPLALQRAAVRQFASKYGMQADQETRHRTIMREQMLAMRDALSGDRSYLCGDFTYADVAMVAALRTIKPEPGSSFGPHCEALLADLELAQEFSDVIAYRDRMGELHGPTLA